MVAGDGGVQRSDVPTRREVDPVVPLIVPCIRSLHNIVAPHPEIFKSKALPLERVFLYSWVPDQDVCCDFGFMLDRESNRVLFYNNWDHTFTKSDAPEGPANAFLETLRHYCDIQKVETPVQTAQKLKKCFVTNFKSHYSPALGIYLAEQELRPVLETVLFA